MDFTNFNIPDFDYGSWDLGLILACTGALFLFLYIMQGRIVDSIVAAIVLGTIISFVAIMAYGGDTAFWFKYLAITIGSPFALAILIRIISKKGSRTTSIDVAKEKAKVKAKKRREPLYEEDDSRL